MASSSAARSAAGVSSGYAADLGRKSDQPKHAGAEYRNQHTPWRQTRTPAGDTPLTDLSDGRRRGRAALRGRAASCAGACVERGAPWPLGTPAARHPAAAVPCERRGCPGSARRVRAAPFPAPRSRRGATPAVAPCALTQYRQEQAQQPERARHGCSNAIGHHEADVRPPDPRPRVGRGARCHARRWKR
jgi:hypothetical protein